MRSPALAMLGQIGNRHRLGLSISAVCLLLMIAAFPPLLRAFPEPYVLAGTGIPPILIFAYMANLLTLTDEVGSMTAGYPRRMYTLPVTTATLVFWPMLFATVAVVSFWFVVTLLVYRPGGFHPPLILPALALAVGGAWSQTVSWSPVKVQYLRLVGAIIGFWILVGSPYCLLLQNTVTSTTLTAVGLLELPVVYGLALLAVRHDRRGDDWTSLLQTLFDRFWTVCDRFTSQPTCFRSAEHAQVWYEMRCHSLMIKASILLVLGSIFVMYLFVPPGKTLAFQIALGSMLAMPLVLGGSQGGSLGRMGPVWSKQQWVITFQAVRPILTGDMLDAKYRMIARNVAELWIIDLVITGTLVLIKGQTGEVASLFRLFMGVYPGWRGLAILGLVVVLIPVLTWKLLADSLVAGLTGRRWIADGSVYLGLLMLMGLISAGLWIAVHPERLHRLLPALIWSMAVLTVVKLLLSAAAFRLVYRRGLLSARSIGRIAAIWTATALATIALTCLLLPRTGLQVPQAVLLVGSLSLLPLGRFALAPLALEWNRHR